jgi:hypothetical protein
VQGVLKVTKVVKLIGQASNFDGHSPAYQDWKVEMQQCLEILDLHPVQEVQVQVVVGAL